MSSYPEDKQAQQSLKKETKMRKVLMVKSQLEDGGNLQVKNLKIILSGS